MAPFLEEAKSNVPTLAQKHSGIPEGLLEKARAVKKETFDRRTKPVNERQRLPVVPQGIERQAFLEALDTLRRDIGAENVEVNDKPLKDGW